MAECRRRSPSTSSRPILQPSDRFVLAAMKLFSENGLAATSIRDIAKESGYTNPAL